MFRAATQIPQRRLAGFWSQSVSMSTAALRRIVADKAPAAIGPFCHAVVANGFVYTSGQLPLVASTMKVLDGDVQAQTRLVLENIKTVLEASGSSVDNIVKTTVFLKDMNDFAKMNEVYAELIGDKSPARSAVQVARLPLDVKVEIECVAVIPTRRLAALANQLAPMSTGLKRIAADKAPAAIGPYCHAVVANGFVYTSGQIPLIPSTMQILDGDIQAQTRLVLENLKAVLEASGTSFDNIVKTTVFLKDMNDFAKMNETYAEMMGSARPARSAVEVARLPRDVKVEIECVAVVPK
eukprot:jgi/Hompol1/1555/HPOL_005635-RA